MWGQGVAVVISLSTEWVDYVEEPMKYQALRPQFFSVNGWWWGGGGRVGSGGVGGGRVGGGGMGDDAVGWGVVVGGVIRLSF